MALATVAIAEVIAVAAAQPWPAEHVRREQAVCEAVIHATVPLTPKQVAVRFLKACLAQVQPLLHTLIGLSVLRRVAGEAYAA